MGEQQREGGWEKKKRETSIVKRWCKSERQRGRGEMGEEGVEGEGGREEEERKKMKGYTPLQQEEVGSEGGERRRENEREDIWVIAAVHHFRGALNGQQPLLC